MSEPYNIFTGQSLKRLTALSDGLYFIVSPRLPRTGRNRRGGGAAA